MHSSEKEKLLADTLAEGDFPEFRQAVFRRARRELRRRRRAWTPWLALAASALLAAFLWHARDSARAPGHPQAPVSEAAAPAPAAEPALAIVRTRPFPQTNIIRSLPNLALLVQTETSASRLVIVITGPEPAPRISDEELLALFGDRPAGLVLTPSGERRLIVMTRPPGNGASEPFNTGSD